MRKLIFCGIVAAAFAGVAFGFTPTRHTNVLTRAGVTYVQRGALGAADYVATNVTMSAADVNALPNNEAQLLAMPAFTNAVRAIGGGGGGTVIGVGTNDVNYLIGKYDTTNLTARINAKADASSVSKMWKYPSTKIHYTAIDWSDATYDANAGKSSEYGMGFGKVFKDEIGLYLGFNPYLEDERNWWPWRYFTAISEGSIYVGVSSDSEDATKNIKIDGEYGRFELHKQNRRSGGTRSVSVYNINLPEKSGTLAVTSDLSGYVPTSIKIAGKSLSGDVTLGTLTVNGQTYNGSEDKTINISVGTETNVVEDIIDYKTIYFARSTSSGTGGGTIGKIFNAYYDGVVYNNMWGVDYSVHANSAYSCTEATRSSSAIRLGWQGAGVAPPYEIAYKSTGTDGSGWYYTDVVGGTGFSRKVVHKGELEQYPTYNAVTTTVNAVKSEFYDQPLQVNWTMRMVNGEMKLYATTNVNMSVLQ